jgi:hypothetical protein
MCGYYAARLALGQDGIMHPAHAIHGNHLGGG